MVENNLKFTISDKEKWYFTFGIGTENKGRFVVLYGTREMTMKKMFRLFGDNWAFQYDSYSWDNYKSRTNPEFKGTHADYWKLKELILK